MDYPSLISTRNLELAWRRMTTGRNLQYKRFFRSIYLAYELARNDNIDRLHQQLAGAWRATPADRIYLPKASGLQRPISLLTVEDQIVLQAVANAYARKLRSRRRKVENKLVFSNVLAEPADSIFFIQDWRTTYDKFQTTCVGHFADGYRWVAHFDLAAFYDTISHEVLVKRVSPRGGHRHTWNRVRDWLKLWSAINADQPVQHGIPQGPIASDFLAECLLLPLDEEMLSRGIRYVRYVDDIRIFSDSRNGAQRAALNLEVYCRELGLIPQARKFSIEEAKSPEQVLGILPSIAPPDRIEEGGPTVEMKEGDAVEKFSAAISGRPYRITDKSVARYVLYRSPKSPKLLGWVLRLLARHPEHIDAFAAYLANYTKSKPTERAISDVLSDGVPYPYFRGELWHVLGRIGTTDTCREMLTYALADLRQRPADTTLRWGALSFLLACQRRGLGLYAHRIRHQSSLVQALLVPVIPPSEFDRRSLIRFLLSSSSYLPGAMLAERLVRRRETHLDYGLKVTDLAPQVQNVFRAVGLVRRTKVPRVDQVGEILERTYGVAPHADWRDVLEAEYVHALQILLQADAVFNAGKSRWLQLQNSFNDALTRAFISFLEVRQLPGRRTLINRNGNQINFGSLLERGNPFDVAHADIAGPFREVNRRRNRLPGSHPYDQKGGARNRYLSIPEQAHLRTRLRLAYSTLIAFVETHA